MSTPITSNITREKIMNKSPITADVICSRAPCTASGLPWEDIILNPAIIIIMAAIPPERPKITDMADLTNLKGSVCIFPTAVSISRQFPLGVKVEQGDFGAAYWGTLLLRDSPGFRLVTMDGVTEGIV